jgi:hypothetical protein
MGARRCTARVASGAKLSPRVVKLVARRSHIDFNFRFQFPKMPNAGTAPQRLRSREGDRYVSDMSDLSAQQVARHRKQGRSAVTNGKRTLIGVRGASKFGRRYRDLVDLYSAEVGGVLTETETAMIKTAAALAIQGEMMQAAIINGEPVNSDDLIRLSSEVRRILDAIGEKAGKRKPAVPKLAAYLASKQAAAEEPEG